MDWKGRGVVLTGASRGLGRVTARALGKEGAQLALVARTAGPLEAVAKEVDAAGGKAVCIAADVGVAADRERLLAEAEKALGPIDILVNNAGVETVALFEQMPFETMKQVIDVNLLAPMALARLVLPGMLARKRGMICNIASMAGKSGPPLAEPYAASKAGLIGFTQSLRASCFGSGVSAVVVCPGFVSGEGMFADRQKTADVKAPGLAGSSTPEEVAAAVVRAVRDDVPQVIVNPGPVKLMGALSELFPRLPGWLMRKMQLRELYLKNAQLPPG